mgnify:CR=1 FL=1
MKMRDNEVTNNKKELMLEVFNSVINDERHQKILKIMVNSSKPDDIIRDVLQGK